MQFGCDTCKAQLQIADEKVRGKRLIVRCKRCGSKIALADPALAKAAPRVVQGPSPAASVAAMRPASRPPPSKPAAARRDSDTESTRAMDSDLLERALQASKSDDPASVQNGAPVSRPPPIAVPSDPPTWFAMLHGKQAGPLTRAELDAKSSEGEVGPRTYLWKDGMQAWQRAKDLPELESLFPQQPGAPPPVPVVTPAAPVATPFSTPDFVGRVEPREGPPATAEARAPFAAKADDEERTAKDPLPLGERVHQEQMARELFSSDPAQKSAADLAKWASEELVKKPAAAPSSPPRVAHTTPMFERHAATGRSGGPFVVFLVLTILAAGAVALWVAFGSGPEKKEEAAKAEPGQPVPVSAVPSAAPEPPRPAPTAEAKKAEPPPKKPEPAPQTTGLTADQVRRKLDENKAALQGCIDDALRRDPNLRVVGQIHIATTIAPSGQVTSAKIDKRTVDESSLGSCLKRTTRRIAFPSFNGDAFDVDIPIVVTAGD